MSVAEKEHPVKLIPRAATPMSLPTVTSVFQALTEHFGLTVRSSQLTLGTHVRDTLLKGGVSCIEAPTGTGKTFGYLAGALEAQAFSAKPVPVVVATATVGLQEQIIRQDVPRLVAIGALDPQKVAVAKGRGRYFCARTAALLEDKKLQDTQFDMFQADKHVSSAGVPVVLDMLKSWRDGKWDGDKDSWKGRIPDNWDAACGASSETCVNSACEHYKTCPYMLSRTKLAQAQLIIANHDLVLADLAQRAEEQSTTALPPKHYALIFDEAHNLPEKAVATKRAVARLYDTDGLRKLEQYGERVLSSPRIAKALEKKFVPADIFSSGAAKVVEGLDRLSKLFGDVKFEGDQFSWGLKQPEESWQKEVLTVSGKVFALNEALACASKEFTDYAEEAVGVEKGFAIRLLAETNGHQRVVADLFKGLASFTDGEQLVRWVVRRKDGGLELHTQPMEGQDVLNKLLWGKNIPVAMVSATIQIAGSFERFRQKTGMPASSLCIALPPVFDYTRGFLHQPNMVNCPGDPGYETELVQKLELLWDKNVAAGTLVLFTSREAMRNVHKRLPERIAQHVLVQGHGAVPELVAQHKAHIDAGRRSMLMGLDTMAEGLDLPGKYCGHVIITRLPFAVPSDPVETARREAMGASKWFNEAYIADMLTTLIQAAGRLIRREDDHGVITVMDNRLSKRKYSKTALAALPNFTRGTLTQEYFDMVKARGFEALLGKGRAQPDGGTAVSTVVIESEKKPEPSRPTLVYAASSKQSAGTTQTHVVTLRNKKHDASQRHDGFAQLAKLQQLPCSLRPPVQCNLENLWETIQLLQPPAKAPADTPYPYLLNQNHPCLSTKAPASVWAERLLPQATLLGLVGMNRPFQKEGPVWQQVMALRPDVIQHAELLRSFRMGSSDVRQSVLSEQDCLQALTRALLPLGAPELGEVLTFLSELEHRAVSVLSSTYKAPNREFLLEMTQTAQTLVGMQVRKGS